MKNMFNVTTVLPHNLLQTNPCIRHNFSTQVFRKRAAQLHYVGPELRYIFRAFLASKGGQKRLENVWHFVRHHVFGYFIQFIHCHLQATFSMVSYAS